MVLSSPSSTVSAAEDEKGFGIRCIWDAREAETGFNFEEQAEWWRVLPEREMMGSIMKIGGVWLPESLPPELSHPFIHPHQLLP